MSRGLQVNAAERERRERESELGRAREERGVRWASACGGRLGQAGGAGSGEREPGLGCCVGWAAGRREGSMDWVAQLGPVKRETGRRERGSGFTLGWFTWLGCYGFFSFSISISYFLSNSTQTI